MSTENKKTRFKFIVDHAVESGEMEGHNFYIVPARFENALNGYVVFKKRPVREQGYDGILAYVPVHGGITFCEQDGSEVMYGFDTVHYNSHEFPRTDHEWIKQQILVMIYGIKIAAKVELRYLKAVTNKGKAKWAQMVQDIQPEQSKNFGVMLNLLSGQL